MSWEGYVNKAQLVESLAERFEGDKKTAATAVEGFIDTIVRSVSKGEKVAITGFGVFEKRDRAARVARNPATGEKVKVKKTSVPAFRAGQGFKDVVSGAKKLPKVAAARKTTTATTRTTTAKSTAAAKTTATKAPAKKTAAKATPAKAPAKRATAAKTTTAAKKAPARKTTPRR